MNRRRLIQGAAVSVLPANGCLKRQSASSGGPIRSRTFEVTEQGPPASNDDGPSVAFRPDTNQVQVTGQMEAGNPCERAALLSAIDENGTLAIEVGTQPTRDILKRVTGCPDSLQVVAYRVTITYEDRLPETVVVTETSDPPDAPRSTTVHRESSE